MIVIISHEEDLHAQRVMARLDRDGHRSLLLNLAMLPNRATLSFDYDSPERPALQLRVDGAVHALGDACSVWWRRPQAADPSSVTDPQLRLFTANEWHEAIGGLWQLMGSPWMNDPQLDEAASRKAWQLHVARQVGLRVPRTLISSDPDAARAFIASQGLERTVYKTFSCTHAVWRETRLLRAEDLALLDALRIAPVIFQEYVPAGIDVRVTVVGSSVFAAAIKPAAGETRVDFRMRVGRSSMDSFTLPQQIDGQLRSLMQRLGLVYGAIDLRISPQGEYFFLEVNTAGEFLFVEERTGLPITEAVANWLAQPEHVGATPFSGQPKAGARTGRPGKTPS